MRSPYPHYLPTAPCGVENVHPALLFGTTRPGQTRLPGGPTAAPGSERCGAFVAYKTIPGPDTRLEMEAGGEVTLAPLPDLINQ